MRWWSLLVLASLLAAGCASPPATESFPAGPPRTGPMHPAPGHVVDGLEVSRAWNGTLGELASDPWVANGTRWIVLQDGRTDGDGAFLAPAGTAASGNPLAVILLGLLEPARDALVEFIGQAYIPGSEIIGWSWDFGDGTTGTGPEASHVYATAGNYTVRLIATSRDGSVTSTSIHLPVAPSPALVSIQATGDVRPLVTIFSDALPVHRVSPGDPVTFTAQPWSGGGNGTTYHWTFGDGASAEGREVTHAYAAEGNYTVRVTMTMASGATAEAAREVQVRLTPPSVRIWPDGGFPGQALRAEAWDYDGSIVSYDWDLGNGTHVFGPRLHITRPGTYNVTLTVTDDDGLTATAFRQVIVHPQPPTVFAIHVASVDEDALAFTFHASASDPDGPIVAYAWDFGDGAVSQEESPMHRYATGGQYQVTVTVTDADGLTATESRSVLVPQ